MSYIPVQVGPRELLAELKKTLRHLERDAGEHPSEHMKSAIENVKKQIRQAEGE